MARAKTDSIARLFTRHGLRCTQQRRALFDALSHTSSHPTAEELFQTVSGRINNLSLATVYNTLEAFCAAGLAQRLPGHGKHTPARYDAGTEPHLHLRSNDCGSVSDVPHDLSDRVLASIPHEVLTELQQRLGFRVREVKVELVGEFVSNGDAGATATRS